MEYERNQIAIALDEAGKRYISLQNFDEARNIYEKLSMEFPYDYRGALGQLVAITHYFLNPIFPGTEDADLVNKEFKRLQALAPANVLYDISSRIKHYVDFSEFEYEKSLKIVEIQDVNDSLSKKIDLIEMSKPLYKYRRNKGIVGMSIVSTIYLALTLLFSYLYHYPMIIGPQTFLCLIPGIIFSMIFLINLGILKVKDSKIDSLKRRISDNIENIKAISAEQLIFEREKAA